MRFYLKKPCHKKLGWWSGSKWRPWVQALVPHTKKVKNKQMNGILIIYLFNPIQPNYYHLDVISINISLMNYLTFLLSNKSFKVHSVLCTDISIWMLNFHWEYLIYLYIFCKICSFLKKRSRFANVSCPNMLKCFLAVESSICFYIKINLRSW
jgi:hypothetical protein